jgi:hypothetical protein
MTEPLGGSLRARLLVRCGDFFRSLGASRLAASAYEAALTRENASPLWFAKLAAAREDLGDWNAAGIAYETALSRANGKLAAAQAGLARMCGRVFDAASSDQAQTVSAKPPVVVAFLPAPSPTKDLASTRIRCDDMISALNVNLAGTVEGRRGFSDDAAAIVISQTCTATTLARCKAVKGRGVRIVYDCCDPYYEQPGAVYGIDVAERFWEIVSIADAVTVPTETMRARLLGAGVTLPIIVVPDSVDYQDQTDASLVPSSKSVVWFGNPGRGNLASGLWALEALAKRFGCAVTLITDPSKLDVPRSFRVEHWSYNGFVTRLRKHGLALVSQDASADYKSENRYVVCLANGIPAISTGSVSIAALLRESGFPEMHVTNEQDLARAIERLGDSARREAYVARMQQVIEARFGSEAVSRSFADQVLKDKLGLKLEARR